MLSWRESTALTPVMDVALMRIEMSKSLEQGHLRGNGPHGSALFFALIAACAMSFRLLAHEPFDCSSRMVVHDDRVEMTTTMGMDGARQLLSAAGFSQEAIAETTRTRGPHSALDLPVTLARRFFELNHDGQNLKARSVAGLSDGIEVIFNVIYPRPTAATLELRAVYYDGIEQMRPGTFFAYDEDRKQLGGALLSRASVTTQVTLPMLESATQAEAVVAAQISDPAINTAGPSASWHTSTESAKPSSLRMLWLCALPIVAAGVWPATRKFVKRNGSTVF